ncbi:MAG: PAS domain-containing protein [Tannerellaceae bacterium]|nr:PAS domain-containing protein [Tannerellaceae bacterium]
MEERYWLAAVTTIALISSLSHVRKIYRRNAQKIAFMFDAIDNADHAIRYAENGRSSSDRLVNRSLNRIIRILFRAKADVIRNERYYELILNSVTTGIIVIDEAGYIRQTNNGALRLIGLPVLTHIKQLRQLGQGIEEFFAAVRPGGRQQISFTNERGTVRLSVSVSETTLRDKPVRILALSDINSELDDKEIDSWIRLTRVLTHEIMNGITPITSLSSTLLSIHGNVGEDLRNGLETISLTGRHLMSFVESYRKFTHIPQPTPSLFYLDKFAFRMISLTRHQDDYPNISITHDIDPGLILYADENLVSQVVLNLLRNAMQAIGPSRSDGRIEIKAGCNDSEAVVMEISNNGPPIPPAEAEHIFVPFYTTKAGGSGIGLSISRQIMRLSGGSISMKSSTAETTFTLTFP